MKNIKYIHTKGSLVNLSHGFISKGKDHFDIDDWVVAHESSYGCYIECSVERKHFNVLLENTFKKSFLTHTVDTSEYQKLFDDRYLEYVREWKRILTCPSEPRVLVKPDPVYDTDDILIYKPTTSDEMASFREDTKWCVSARRTDVFYNEFTSTWDMWILYHGDEKFIIGTIKGVSTCFIFDHNVHPVIDEDVMIGTAGDIIRITQDRLIMFNKLRNIIMKLHNGNATSTSKYTGILTMLGFNINEYC